MTPGATSKCAIGWIVALSILTLLALPLDATTALWMRDHGVEDALKSDWRWLATLLKCPGEYWCAVASAALLALPRERAQRLWLAVPLGASLAAFAEFARASIDQRVDHVASVLFGLPGQLIVVVIAVTALVCWGAPHWKLGTLVLAAAIASSLNGVVKWMVGRYRPFKAPPYLDQAAPFYVEPFRGGLFGIFRQTNLSFPSGHGCLAFALATALAILLPRRRAWWFAIASLTAAERVAENAHHLSDSIASATLGVLFAFLAITLTQRLMDEPSTPNPSSTTL